MGKVKNYFHDEIMMQAMTKEEIQEMAYELEIEEKDKYYQQHPEEINDGDNGKQ